MSHSLWLHGVTTERTRASRLFFCSCPGGNGGALFVFVGRHASSKNTHKPSGAVAEAGLPAPAGAAIVVLRRQPFRHTCTRVS
jgi:hypothetical protein